MNPEDLKMNESEKATLYILLGNVRVMEKLIDPSDSKLRSKLDFLTEMIYDLQYADKPCSEVINYISEKLENITEDLIITRG